MTSTVTNTTTISVANINLYMLKNVYICRYSTLHQLEIIIKNTVSVLITKLVSGKGDAHYSECISSERPAAVAGRRGGSGVVKQGA